MSARAIPQPRLNDSLAITSRSSRPDGVRLLQVFALTVMVVPSTTVIGAIGAPGYPGSLVGISVFLVYAVTVLLGVHNPTSQRHPIQAVLCLVWLSALASYLLMDRATLTVLQLKGADRYLVQLAVITGIALVAAEWTRSLGDARRVLRVLCWGGAFCGVVAALQYGFNLDLAQYIRELPGFTQNHDNPATVARGSLNRATGTAITPIELGVAAGMLVPLSIYLGMYDTERGPMKRWAPAALISLGIGTSISRSAILAVVVAFGVLLVLLPPVPRLRALFALPFATAATFMVAHGLIGTLASFFTVGNSDVSIQWRVQDYALVERLWGQAPWFGHGGWTYMPNSALGALDYFDNQYLGSLVDLGVVGLVALLVFLVMPAMSALVARSRTKDTELRILCAALAGAGFAAAVCSFTFDSLAFPMFVSVYATVIGLVGACWRLAAAEGLQTADDPPRHGAGPSPTDSQLQELVQPRRAVP